MEGRIKKKDNFSYLTVALLLLLLCAALADQFSSYIGHRFVEVGEESLRNVECTVDAAAILEEEGLTWAQSSVHINAWIGSFDKASMVERYLKERCDVALDEVGDTLVYVISTTNSGPSSPSDVALVDSLPAGVTFVDATNSGTESGGVTVYYKTGFDAGPEGWEETNRRARQWS